MVQRIRVGPRHEALIDDDDLDLVRRHRWHLKTGKGLDYARTDFYVDGKRCRLFMHRLILGSRPGELTDHVDGNGLNNQRANLRKATHSENQRNRAKRKRSADNPFKGVHRRRDVWIAMIRINKRQHVIGVFDTAELAARAYDETARAAFGEFARPNN